VQTKDLTPRRLGFCHSYALAFAVLSCGATCAASPLIARIYGEPALTPMICASAAKLLFVGASLVPLQSLNRALDFKRVSLIVTLATLFAACTRIGLAAAGFGAWASVLGNTAHGVFVFLGTLALSRHWPKPTWAWSECRDLRAFGIKTTSASALYHFYRNADFFLVGRFLGTELLGLYRVAFDIAMVPAMMILTVVNRASFPVYSRIAGDVRKLAETFAWNARNMSLLILPLCLVIGFTGSSLVEIVGRHGQWSGAGPAVAVLSAAACLRCFDQFFPQLFNAAGRAGYSFLDSVFSTLVFCGLFFLGLFFFGDRFGILAVCGAWVVSYFILYVPLWMMARRIVPLELGRFVVSTFKDSSKGTILTAAVLAGAALLLDHLGASAWARLIVLGATAVGTYLLWLRLDLGVSVVGLVRGGGRKP